MKKIAFIVYGSEFSFKRDSIKLRKYLREIGVDVETCSLSGPFFSRLEKIIQQQGRDDLILLVYIGHGWKNGWDGSWSRPEAAYSSLSELLENAGPLMVVNDTCYGLRLLHLLRKKRSEENTSFLAPFGSRGVTAGAVVANMLHYWPQGQTVEDRVSGVVRLRHDGSEYEYSPQVRWGVFHDQHFFGEKPKRILTRGEPIQLG